MTDARTIDSAADSGTIDEQAESAHLAQTIDLILSEARRLDVLVDASATEIMEHKQLIWQNQRELDHAEKANIRTQVDVTVNAAQHAVERHRRLQRLVDSPYFGRVDFQRTSASTSAAHYIGLYSFRHPESHELVVHDWRAPVSSLYYDYESGEASYQAPEGIAHGSITGKRQYKIEKGSLEYVIESTLTIGDDVLQRELSRSADEKMKNIVATIQREQNAVIRNETAQVLILQGVAGSGKTSIALHRVAFLLYRFADSLSSDNVMILSPNKVFGDYISSVLPELGEEQVAEIDFDTIAHRFLRGITSFESFSEQVTRLLEGVDDATTARIRAKSSPAFLAELESWIDEQAVSSIRPAPITVRGETLDLDWVEQSFDAIRRTPIFNRLERIAESAVLRLKQGPNIRSPWKPADTNEVRKQVRAMFPFKDALALYRGFYDDEPRRGLYQPLGRSIIEHADVFPLILTMLRTSRHETFGEIRHLVVDEMQDYTPVQYAVLRTLFSCPMTILGDANQSVNPYSSSSLDTIRSVFDNVDALELCRSYRSTTEITSFAQRIKPNDKLIPVDRPGVEPRLVAFETFADEVDEIARILGTIGEKGYRSCGVITKTVREAQALHEALGARGIETNLLDYGSTAFTHGITVTSAHISKGLEFDLVVVPHVDDDTYATTMDKGMLYIACTRAMHELHLTRVGALTEHLRFAEAA